MILLHVLKLLLPLLQEMRTDIKGIVRRRDGEIDYDDLIVELKNRSGEVEALCLAVPSAARRLRWRHLHKYLSVRRC